MNIKTALAAEHKQMLRRYIRKAQDDIRDERDDAKIAALMHSFRSQGFQGALTVFKVDEACEGHEMYEVVDGSTSLIALERLGVEEVLVNILLERPDPKTLRMMRLRKNLLHSDMLVLEEARNFRELMQDNGWTQKELARELAGEQCIKKFETRISKALKIYDNLIDALKDILNRKEMADKSAWAIAGLPAEVQLPFWNEHTGKKAEAIVDLVNAYWEKQGHGKPKEKPVTGTTPAGVKYSLPTKDLKATLAELKRLVAGWEWVIAKKMQPGDLEFYFRSNPA